MLKSLAVLQGSALRLRHLAVLQSLLQSSEAFGSAAKPSKAVRFSSESSGSADKPASAAEEEEGSQEEDGAHSNASEDERPEEREPSEAAKEVIESEGDEQELVAKHPKMAPGEKPKNRRGSADKPAAELSPPVHPVDSFPLANALLKVVGSQLISLLNFSSKLFFRTALLYFSSEIIF